MLLPKIYPITDTYISALSHANQTEKLADGGANFIQLREKKVSPIDFYKSAKEAIEIGRRMKSTVLINDRVDLALVLKADGVHLGQDDLPPAKAREILGNDAIIGFSTHNKKQAVKACKLPVDYIAIGPVFETATKKNSEQTIGIEGLKRIREAIGDFPLVAIGGINFANFREVLAAGSDSVAIITGLLTESDDISANFRKYLSLLG